MSEKVPQDPAEPQQDRQSRVVRKEALPELTASQKAEQEATNTLLQYDRMVELIDVALHSKVRFRLRPSTLQELNRISIEGLEKEAGRWRDVPMEIDLSHHEPPHWRDVPRLVDEMCEYINDKWEERNAFHLAAFVMWRLNWIHPFVDGNGRTTRVTSYYVFCSRLGFHIPGVKTVPEMIAENKAPYYQALEKADAAYKDGNVDVSEMEELLRNLLARQMVIVLERDNGGAAPPEVAKLTKPNVDTLVTRRESKSSRALRSGWSATFGGISLLFFMILTLLSVFGHSVPVEAHYLVRIVLSLSGALSVAFLGGNASARGRIRLPYLEDPLTVATSGGIATLLILLILSKYLVP